MNMDKDKFYSRLISFIRNLSAIILSIGMILGAECNPPQTVDLPAGSLDVIITISDVNDQPSDGKVLVFMQFLSNGKIVLLQHDIHLTCDGVILTDHGLGYAERVPIKAQGGKYTFTYNRMGTSKEVSVNVIKRPSIIIPSENSTVTRTSNLSIVYFPESASSIRGGAADQSTALGGSVQSDNGVYTGLDVSTLNAGPGTINIVKEYTFQLTTSFKSTKINYSSGTSKAVIWK